ncbi:MAG: hypothetical protein QM582_03350 [Micropruina sp.]|uniref:hypothetical protein n=1 Tax=Micropruina sp. TaxID=2737536 RepID=UPI0039E6DEA2
MSLFDQQPMGPVPARRPMIIGQDPDSAQAGIDLPTTRVEVLAPIPRELAAAAPYRRRRHPIRIAVGVLVLAPMLVELLFGLASLIRSEDDPEMQTPRVLAIGIVLVVIGCAHLVFRYLAGRR